MAADVFPLYWSLPVQRNFRPSEQYGVADYRERTGGHGHDSDHGM